LSTDSVCYMQSLTGDIDQAMKTLHNYHQVWRQYGFLPEFYNIPKSEAQLNRDSYPLRPGWYLFVTPYNVFEAQASRQRPDSSYGIRQGS
jgi:hypothetical protein